MSRQLIDPHVLLAFGIADSLEPESLPGGRSLCVKVGDIILRPSDDDVESQWVARFMKKLRSHESTPALYQVARPIPRTDDEDNFICDGWTAWSLLPGKDGPDGHFEEILRIGRAFHEDLARLDVERPSFLGERSNRWHEADLVTWHDRDLKDVPKVNEEMLNRLAKPLRELKQLHRPLPDLKSQLIHLDLTGNVLFDTSGNSLPGIIDMTFYWRPAAYAGAVVVTDGLMWHGQGRELVEAYGTDEVSMQLLVRAMYWRFVTFAIDPDMEWVKAHMGRADFVGPVELVRGMMET